MLFPLLLSFLLLRLVFWFNTFPNPDEAYYWLWGQHPGWSYYDHPPLQAWVQGLFAAAFGRSPLVLRLPNLISNGLFFYTYYRIVRYLYGRDARYHFWILWLLVLASPLYFLFLALAWHDHWLITFSLISAYLFIRFLDGYLVDGRGKSWRLYGAAGTIALAGLCKYSAAFVVLGCGAAVIADKRLHSLGRDRRIYWAGAIAASALIPILIWNFSNDFQSFRYYVNRSVNTGSFSLKIGPFLNFVLFSFLLVSPAHWISFLRSLKYPDPSISTKTVYPAVAFWVFIIPTVTLTAISLVSAALYYWNIIAYLLLFPLASSFFLRTPSPSFLSSPSSSLSPPPPFSTTHNQQPATHNPPTPLLLKHKSLFLGSQFYGLLFAGLLVVHYSLLPLSALVSQEEDPDSRMLFGWNTVATEVRAAAAEVGHNPFLVATDYRTASALAYQLNDRNVLAISDRVDQFDFWYTCDEPFQGKNAVILSDDWHPIQSELLAQFEQTSAARAVPVTQFGVWIKNYYIVKGYRFKGGRVASVSHCR
jgi:hypothetical protein